MPSLRRVAEQTSSGRISSCGWKPRNEPAPYGKPSRGAVTLSTAQIRSQALRATLIESEENSYPARSKTASRGPTNGQEKNTTSFEFSTPPKLPFPPLSSAGNNTGPRALLADGPDNSPWPRGKRTPPLRCCCGFAVRTRWSCSDKRSVAGKTAFWRSRRLMPSPRSRHKSSCSPHVKSCPLRKTTLFVVWCETSKYFRFLFFCLFTCSRFGSLPA